MTIEWMAPWWAAPVVGFGAYAIARFATVYVLDRCGRDDDPSQHEKAA